MTVGQDLPFGLTDVSFQEANLIDPSHGDIRAAVLVLPRGSTAVREDVLEIATEAGGPIFVPVTLRREVALSTLPGGCRSDVLVYDLTAVEQPRFLIVHRLSRAPPGLSTPLRAGDVTTFDGEPALVGTIVRVDSRLDPGDAGTADAGTAADR